MCVQKKKIRTLASFFEGFQMEFLDSDNEQEKNEDFLKNFKVNNVCRGASACPSQKKSRRLMTYGFANNKIHGRVRAAQVTCKCRNFNFAIWPHFVDV